MGGGGGECHDPWVCISPTDDSGKEVRRGHLHGVVHAGLLDGEPPAQVGDPAEAAEQEGGPVGQPDQTGGHEHLTCRYRERGSIKGSTGCSNKQNVKVI